MRLALLILLGAVAFVSPAVGMTIQSTSSATVFPWGSFTAGRSIRRDSQTIRVEVAHIWRLAQDGRTRIDFWTAEKRSEPRVGLGKLQWADSRTCPALIPSLAKLADLEPIRMTPPGVTAPAAHLILDGQSFEIVAPGVFPLAAAAGEVRLTGNVDSPMGTWVSATLNSLGPCWSDTPPTLDG